MCVALGIIGTVIGAVGSIVSGISQKNAYNAQAKAFEANAANDRVRAEQSAREGARKEGLVREKGEQIEGSNNAAYGAAGVTGGSAWDVLRSSQYNVERDAAAVSTEAGRNAWGYHVNAVNSVNKANQARAAGAAAMTEGILGAAASVLASKTMLNKFGGGGYSGPKIPGQSPLTTGG